MNTILGSTGRMTAAFALLAVTGAAFAGDELPASRHLIAAVDAKTSTEPRSLMPSVATMPKSPFAGPPVSSRLLANSRAGTAGTVVTESGALQQNSATNVQTGANAIGGGSFANALGLTTVIQNSGANVLIQNATTINVQFK